MDRGYIYVNKKSFINNLQYLSQVSKKKTCLVVKANAYGHGVKWSVRNAREAGVEWFAVASIEEGIQVKQEITDLNAGLKDTVKALSEELDIKPAMLNKAIGVAFKAGLHEEQAKLEELETILATVGKTQ